MINNNKKRKEAEATWGQDAKRINQFVPLITASSHEREEYCSPMRFLAERRGGKTHNVLSAWPRTSTVPSTPQYRASGLVQHPQASPVQGESRHPGAAAVVAQAGVHPGLGEDDIDLVLLGRGEKNQYRDLMDPAPPPRPPLVCVPGCRPAALSGGAH